MSQDKTKDALKDLLSNVTEEKPVEETPAETEPVPEKTKKKTVKESALDALAEEPVAQEEVPEKPAEEPVVDADVQQIVVEKAVEAVKAQVKEVVDNAVRDAVEDASDDIEEVADEMDADDDDDDDVSIRQHGAQSREAKPHAFVVMPFGTKYGAEGQVYNFNAIYQDLIKPALIEAGFEPFRADDETATGDILTDMFQELLLADLAICDLSIDNANVFYELGIRHAFRKRGVVHIQAGRAYMPFDIFNVRTIPYNIGEDGLPDPEFLEKDIQSIARTCRDTWASDRDAIHSPVFNLLTGLDEPDRKDLRTPLATGFWREYNEWRQRVTVAERQKRIGDIMLLTEEISNPLIKEEAIDQAGSALRSMNRHELALQQYRSGIELNSENIHFRREEAFHLNRLGRVDEAIVKLEDLLQDHPTDTDATAYLGRIYKDMWTESWIEIDDDSRRIQEAFDSNHWLVKSIHTYMRGYYADLNNYYPGINALTLAIILDHLAERFEDDDDPDVTEVRRLLPMLRGTLQFSLENMTRDDFTAEYWTLVSLADLMVMTADHPKVVKRAYKKALTAARKNIFYLQSSISQLDMLDALDLRPEFVDTGVTVLKDEIRRILKDQIDEEETEDRTPKEQKVFLFAGHKIDADNRRSQRFPAEMEEEARKKIDEALEKYDAGNGDIAFTPGAACGGEIIFIEACMDLGLEVEVHLPFAEPKYIKDNVSIAGDEWVDRFYNLRNNPLVSIRQQSDHVGKVKADDDPYERNNLWSMYSSLLHGVDRVRLLALWDGLNTPVQEGDKMLVSHMVEEMRHMGGKVEHINTTKFDYWQAGGKVGKALDALAGL